jgi:DNA-binding NarL/FixJ family response regulator
MINAVASTVPAARRWPLGPEPEQEEELARVLTVFLLELAESAGRSGYYQGAAWLRDIAGQLTETASGSAPGDGGHRHDRPGRELTCRELEVTELIAQGMTNRHIAAVLRISERTADTHVQNILSKLGMARRAQIATWAVRHRLYASLLTMTSHLTALGNSGRRAG